MIEKTENKEIDNTHKSDLVKDSVDDYEIQRKKEGIRPTAIVRQSYHEGPLPPAKEMERYEDILPGSADRMITMTEKQVDHQIKCEQEIVTRTHNNSRRGQNYALITVVSGLLSSIVLAWLNQPWPSATVGGGSLFGIVAVFITGKNAERKASKNTDADLPSK